MASAPLSGGKKPFDLSQQTRINIAHKPQVGAPTNSSPSAEDLNNVEPPVHQKLTWATKEFPSSFLGQIAWIEAMEIVRHLKYHQPTKFQKPSQ